MKLGAEEVQTFKVTEFVVDKLGGCTIRLHLCFLDVSAKCLPKLSLGQVNASVLIPLLVDVTLLLVSEREKSIFQ